MRARGQFVHGAEEIFRAAVIPAEAGIQAFEAG